MNNGKVNPSIKIVAVITLRMIGITMILLPQEISAASKVKAPGQVKGLSVKAKGSTQLNMIFKQVRDASGYKIFQATEKNGKYHCVKTLSKGKFSKKQRKAKTANTPMLNLRKQRCQKSLRKLRDSR